VISALTEFFVKFTRFWSGLFAWQLLCVTTDLQRFTLAIFAEDLVNPACFSGQRTRFPFYRIWSAQFFYLMMAQIKTAVLTRFKTVDESRLASLFQRPLNIRHHSPSLQVMSRLRL